MKKLNENIRAFRIYCNLTQQDLSEALGKSKNVISNWERGDNSPSQDEILKLCQIFTCTPNQLLGWEASPDVELDSNIRKFSAVMKRAYNIIYRSLAVLDEVRDCRSELEQFQKDFEAEYEHISLSLIDIPSLNNQNSCFLYYILNEEKDKVKIGISGNPMSRAREIQTSSGEEIELLHTIEFDDRESALYAESHLHRCFSKWRKKPTKVARSCEWFDSCIIPYLREKYWTASQIIEDEEATLKETEEVLNCLNSISCSGGIA